MFNIEMLAENSVNWIVYVQTSESYSLQTRKKDFSDLSVSMSLSELNYSISIGIVGFWIDVFMLLTFTILLNPTFAKIHITVCFRHTRCISWYSSVYVSTVTRVQYSLLKKINISTNYIYIYMLKINYRKMQYFILSF